MLVQSRVAICLRRGAPALACLLLSAVVATTQARASCPMPGDRLKAPPMLGRFPVVIGSGATGGTAELAAGFGMRPHPLLGDVRMHTGHAWRAPAGADVIAVAAGRVARVGRDGHYGNRIVLDHGGGWQSAYAHLRRAYVAVGDCVAEGAVIASVGSTGLVDGPLLLLEILKDGAFVDPATLPTR